MSQEAHQLEKQATKEVQLEELPQSAHCPRLSP
jgi:hypothetical protein